MTEENGVQPDLQPIYNLYCALAALGEMGGRLVFYRGLNANAAAAANIAGAASLSVDPDAERIKQALRDGVCDFMVNHLDEALRILKNEIRKRQPVSVCLHADAESCMVEMIERGVQPDVLMSDMAAFVDRGARVVTAALQRPHDRSVTWDVAEHPARWLPKLDEIAARVLDAADPTTAARGRWLRLAPRYVGRALHHQRFLRMTGDESEQLLALVREASARGEIAAPLRITFDGFETLIG